MTELLSVLTAVFVVYVLYEVFATVSQCGDDAANKPASPAPPDAKPTPRPQNEPAPTAALAEAAPVSTPDIPAATEAHKTISLRDPVSGEVSPSPSNYRFAKKWIKEAMVAEGLLKKIYKNSELTETVNTQVKEALEQFKKLPKYHA